MRVVLYSRSKEGLDRLRVHATQQGWRVGEAVVEAEPGVALKNIVKRLRKTRLDLRAAALLFESLDEVARGPVELLRLCGGFASVKVELHSCRKGDADITRSAIEVLSFGARMRKSRVMVGEKTGRPPLPLSAEDARALEAQFGSVPAASAATGISISTLRRRRSQGEATSHG